MGYTHYWTQLRDLTDEEWADALEHVAAILKDVEFEQSIPLADMEGKARTKPEFTDKFIAFNGVGEDSHETFKINRRMTKEWEGGRLGADFCKTARKPYDLAVTACLSYFSSVVESHDVSSDGDGEDWLAGVDEARRALPRFANVLDIPKTIMENDRWCMPWVNCDSEITGFSVNFCVDGRGYVIRKKDQASYCFESHTALAKFLDRTKYAKFKKGGRLQGFGGSRTYGSEEPNIWNATGCFDPARHDRITKAQVRILKTLFPVDPSCAQSPPLYVRPGEFPPPARRAYYFSELLSLAD